VRATSKAAPKSVAKVQAEAPMSTVTLPPTPKGIDVDDLDLFASLKAEEEDKVGDATAAPPSKASGNASSGMTYEEYARFRQQMEDSD